MIAGSIARVFDKKVTSANSKAVLRALEPMAISVNTWPHVPLLPPSPPPASADLDTAVRHYCLSRVDLYIEEHGESNDADERGRVELLRFLLYHLQAFDDTRYVGTWKIRAALNSVGAGVASIHEVRSKLIAPLRDRGVILASSSHGYKIPTRVKDLQDFVSRADAVVLPMLNRLGRAREDVKLATSGRLDILADPKFSSLAALIQEAGKRE